MQVSGAVDEIFSCIRRMGIRKFDSPVSFHRLSLSKVVHWGLLLLRQLMMMMLHRTPQGQRVGL
jgi:hypothetical protein